MFPNVGRAFKLLLRRSVIFAGRTEAMPSQPEIQIGLVVKDLALSRAQELWSAPIDPQLVEIALAGPEIGSRLGRRQ